MKKYALKFLTLVIIVNLIGCGNSQQNVSNESKIDTTANQTIVSKTEKIKQKIAPCL